MGLGGVGWGGVGWGESEPVLCFCSIWAGHFSSESPHNKFQGLFVHKIMAIVV